MTLAQPYDIPTAGRFDAAYLAKVVSVKDPDNTAKVQVQLLSLDPGTTTPNAPIWARVAVPFAGGNRGAFMLPEEGDEVLVTFINGDSRYPIIVGSLWNGNDTPPEQLGGDGRQIDRWTIVGKAGTRIAIVEENEATISLTTPGGVSFEMTDSGGGKIELTAAGTTVTIDSGGMSITTPSNFEVQAGQIQEKAGQVTVTSALAKFSGIVTADLSVKTATVISNVYVPGAGNVW